MFRQTHPVQRRRTFTEAQPRSNTDPTLPVHDAWVLGDKNHVTRSRVTALLLAAVAVFSVGCGGGEEAAASVASLADVEVAATPELEIPDDAVEDPAATQEPESAETSADPTDTTESNGSTNETNTSEAAEAELSDEDMALAFVECVREAGIDEMPDPTVRADGSVELLPVGQRQVFQNPDFEAAAEGCVDLIEDATFFSETADLSAIEDSLLEFAQCLRENGVEVDDPDLTKFVPGQGARMFGDDFDPQDPANADAIAACSSLLPNAAGN